MCSSSIPTLHSILPHQLKGHSCMKKTVILWDHLRFSQYYWIWSISHQIPHLDTPYMVFSSALQAEANTWFLRCFFLPPFLPFFLSAFLPSWLHWAASGLWSFWGVLGFEARTEGSNQMSPTPLSDRRWNTAGWLVTKICLLEANLEQV